MKKKGLLIVIILLVAVALVGVGVVAKTQSKNAQIAEQLDLGQKYLDELDYEKAIATYMGILEIEPNNMAVYQGIVDAYIRQEDYDNALKYAKEGYAITEDTKLADLQKQIEQLIAEKEAARLAAEKVAAEEAARLAAEKAAAEEAARLAAEKAAAEEEARKAAEAEEAARKALFEGHFMDGIWHNAYNEYELAEEDASFLQQLIDNANAGDYEAVFTLLASDGQIALLEKLELFHSSDEGKRKTATARIAYDMYKIYIHCDIHYDTEVEITRMNLIPVQDGQGYAFGYNENGAQVTKNYLVCACLDGMYNGEVSGERIYVSEEGENRQVEQIEGAAVNGLREGIWLTHRYVQGEFRYTSMSEYTGGAPKAYEIEQKENYNIYWTEVSRDENGNPNIKGTKSGLNLTPEQFEKVRWGVCWDQYYSPWERDGGYSIYTY